MGFFTDCFRYLAHTDRSPWTTSKCHKDLLQKADQKFNTTRQQKK